MIDTKMDRQKENDASKEEGEITDDDELEELREEAKTSRRQHYESTHSSVPQDTFSPPSTESSVLRHSRGYHPSGTRPFQNSPLLNTPSSRSPLGSSTSSRSYNSPESPPLYRGAYRPERHGNEYRDLHNQRPRNQQYDQPSQNTSPHLPNSARSWRQRKFCPSANRNTFQTEAQYSCSAGERSHHMNSSAEDYYDNVAKRTDFETVVHHRSTEGSFRMTSSDRSDYDRLLRLHAQVQDKIRIEEERAGSSETNISTRPVKGSSTEPPSSDKGHESFSSPASAGTGFDRQSTCQHGPAPRMTIAEAASDVSSDEIDSGDVEVVDSSETENSPARKSQVAAPPAAKTVSADSCDREVCGHTVSSDTCAGGACVEPSVSPVVAESDGANSQSVVSQSASSTQVPAEEEDDEDELELRRIALASAAQRLLKQVAESEDALANSQQASETESRDIPTAVSSQQVNESEDTVSVSSLQISESEAGVPVSSQSQASSTVMSPKAPGSETLQSVTRTGVSKLDNASPPKSTISKVSSQKSDSKKQTVPKSKIHRPDSSARRRHTSEHQTPASVVSRDRTNDTGRVRERTSSSSDSKSRTSRSKKEKENSGRRTRSEKDVPSKRPRALPFAPVRIDKISLKSLTPRTSGLTEAAKRAQRRARQTSVARQLPPPSSSSRSSRHQTRTSSDLHRSNNDADKKRAEQRRQEIAKILSMTDETERMDRILKLISCEAVESSSPLKTTQKIPSMTDNYEEVEMDIDSDDDIAEALQIEDIQTAMQPVPYMSAGRMDFTGMDLTNYDYLLRHGLWMSPYIPAVDMYSHPIPYAVHPPLPPQPPPQPPPPLPPAKEDVFPPPPPPEEELPPPPPPPEFLSPETGAAASESKTRIDEQRMSDIAQFIQDARARQANAEETVSALNSSPKVLTLSPAEPYTPEQKHSSEDVDSVKHTPFYYDPNYSPSYTPTQSPVVSTPQKTPGYSDDVDEEDLNELRAQLLRSVLLRRRENAQEKATSTSSRDSSPSASSAASPQHVTAVKAPTALSRKVHMQKAIAYTRRMMELPVHKPVVVQLGDSSSEDEDGQETRAPVSCLDIDSFLKAQRKSVESQQTTVKPSDVRIVEMQDSRGSILQQELSQKEQELTSLRHSIEKDQAQLKELFGKLNKFMSEKKRAEMRVAQLKKQLLATEQLLAGNTKLVSSGKEQVKQMKDNVLRKKKTYGVAEAEVLSMGRRLLGADYVLRPTTTLENNLKRKVEVPDKGVGVSITFQPSPSKKRRLDPSAQAEAHEEYVPSPCSPQNIRGQSRADKMAGLQRQSEAIMEEINRLKIKAQKKEQLSVSVNSTGDRRAVIEDTSEVPDKHESRLPSLESIKLEPVDGDEVSTVKSRRRSLLDMSQSSKPMLLMKEPQSTPDQTQGLKAAPGAENKKGHIDFKMPSGSQLSYLCTIQREKVEKILSNPMPRLHEMFSCLTPQCDPIPELKVVLPGSKQSKEEGSASAKLTYTSPLLQFRAFRFSPYYRTKEGLTITSSSFCHKLNPNRVLCRYDMQGTCNDQHCTWQHGRDYKLSDRWILMDLVSYCPRLAGVTDDTPHSAYATVIGDYVDNLLAQHKGKMTTDDLCLLLTAKVNEAAKHVSPGQTFYKSAAVKVRPHTMFYDRRPWRPSAGESTTFSLSIMSQFQTPADTIRGAVQSVQEVDSVLDVDDVRYFVSDSTEGENVQDMEGAVLATPTDTQLWLRLAYSKLSNPVRSSEECLSQALNVLSRGLENNRKSTELWVHYLMLFRRHPDSDTDFTDLCQTALACAPCYDLWWLLLEAGTGFHEKDSVCSKILDFLCEKNEKQTESGEQQDEDADLKPDEVRSHQVLEILLYKVRLNIQSGRFKTALNSLEMVLGTKESKGKERLYFKNLTHADKCVLWICLVHLVEFQTLPAVLYDPANENPGPIRSKDKLYIPWHSKANLATPLETLVHYLGFAVSLNPDKPLDNSTSAQYVMTVLNLAELLRSRGKYIEACKVLKEVLQWLPHLEEIWLMVADIYTDCQDFDNARQVFLDGTSSNIFSAKLHYHAAVLEMSQENIDEALERMEQFVLGYYDISRVDMARVDPNFLFLKLLGLDVPVHKKIPPLKEKGRQVAAERNVYLWLCYCLLQELQGESGEVINTYEIALSATTGAADLCQLWKCYIQFLYRQHQKHASSNSQNTLQQLQEAMMRSIITAPTLVPVPFPRQHRPEWQQWRDLSHVTSLVEFYMELMPSDVVVTALHSFYDLMPRNVSLLIRCVEMAIEDGQTRRARSLCTTAVYDKLANLHLWKLALALAQQEGTPKEVERLYVRAVTAMPLCVSLWKDFLLFEVSQENPMAVRTILAQCQNFGLNIQGYVATIASTKSS